MSRVNFQNMSFLYVSVAYFFPCRMSNLRKAHVACRHLFKLTLHVTKVNIAILN